MRALALGMVGNHHPDNNARMTTRLQIAARIHFLLLRELGEGIRVERMLRDRLYTRDVLLVCDAIKLPELNALASEFRESLENRRVLRSVSPVVPQADTWGADTSGFGVSEPPKASEPEAPPGWLQSTWRWLGR